MRRLHQTLYRYQRYRHKLRKITKATSHQGNLPSSWEVYYHWWCVLRFDPSPQGEPVYGLEEDGQHLHVQASAPALPKPFEEKIQISLRLTR